MFKKNLKYRTFSVYSAVVGEEIVIKNDIWKVLAITGEEIISHGYGGTIKKVVYCEHQCTILERMREEIKDLQDKVLFIEKDIPNRPGVLEKPPLSISPLSEDDGKEPRRLKANCGVCGAMLYEADSIYTFKEVFDVERPYCFHCGNRIQFRNRIVK